MDSGTNGEAPLAPEGERFFEGLFEGDTGTLDYEQRCAVMALIRKRYVSDGW